jgi:Ca-activated chloride channel family protein
VEKRIVDTSLKHGVLSRFTAFVAVDQRVVNEGGKVHRVTQPVDLPSGWEQQGAQPMQAFGGFDGAAPGGMPTYGAAAPAAFARAERFTPLGGRGGRAMPSTGMGSSKRARAPQPPLDFGGGAGLQQGGPPPAYAPESADVFEAERADVAAPPDTSLSDFVTAELGSLKSAAAESVWTRAGLLTALSERIRVLLGPWQAAGEPTSSCQALSALSAELAIPTADPAEVDRRWHHTITILESLTTNAPPRRTRRAFWKR